RALESATRAQLEPIVALCPQNHPGQPGLADAVEPVLAGAPCIRVRDAHAVHELWACPEASVHQQVDRVVSRGALLIADGHHRFQAWSAATGNPSEHRNEHGSDPRGLALAMLVDPGGLRLGAVHRVVNNLSLGDALAVGDLDYRPLDSEHAAREYLSAMSPDGCVLAAQGQFLAIRPRPGRRSQYAVEWLHTEWLPALHGDLGVEDPAVQYVHSVEYAVDHARAPNTVAVLLPALGLDAVLDAARHAVLLP